jgi:5-oxoprolinase (ATP-hydrolysing)/N-methylhydantoinase A
MGGGQGASSKADGKSGLLFPTSAANTPVELLESRMPVLVMEKALVADSAGPGRQRGGLGQRMRARRLYADAEPIMVGLYPEGVGLKPEGLFGGKPGAPGRGMVKAPGEMTPRDVGTGEMVALLDPASEIEGRIAGGSGFGEAWQRSLEAVQTDLDDNYITPEGAMRDYGVVLGADGRIDPVASARRRAEHQAAD